MELKESKIRPPAVAGSFYPDNPQVLRQQVEDLLIRADRRPRAARKPKIVIVPHAGFKFSGQTAAYAYALIGQFSYSTVILIGPAHFYSLSQAVTCAWGFWETPLGQVKVSEAWQQKLNLPVVDRAFVVEHSLEVQLPFLQLILKQFEIVPILLNELDRQFSLQLAHLWHDDWLLVVSSDLSHFWPQKEAEVRDKRTIEVILKRQIDLRDRVEACGQAGIAMAISLAQYLRLSSRLLHYTTSAEVSGNLREVVGYATISFA